MLLNDYFDSRRQQENLIIVFIVIVVTHQAHRQAEGSLLGSNDVVCLEEAQQLLMVVDYGFWGA